MSNSVDKDLPVSEAFVEEMMAGSIGTSIDLHWMQFMLRVAVPDGHEKMIAHIRRRLEFWPHTLPPHHRELAEELIVSLERKKCEATERQRLSIEAIHRLT